jgi:uncharacterized protein (DUF1330 family)
MKAFLVTESEILDQPALAAYTAKVRDALRAAGGRPAVISSIGGKIVALVGEPPRNLVVSEWQSLAAAQAWVNSAELAAIAPQREKAYRVIRQYIVEAPATSGDRAMAKFDAETLRDLRDVQEIAIQTEKHPEDAVVIWVVVADDEVFVRSVRGAKGRWYRDLAAGGPATLEFAGRRLAVQAIPATDQASIDRASREYLKKYQRSPYAKSMVSSDALPTTLRLEPR